MALTLHHDTAYGINKEEGGGAARTHTYSNTVNTLTQTQEKINYKKKKEEKKT